MSSEIAEELKSASNHELMEILEAAFEETESPLLIGGKPIMSIGGSVLVGSMLFYEEDVLNVMLDAVTSEVIRRKKYDPSILSYLRDLWNKLRNTSASIQNFWDATNLINRLYHFFTVEEALEAFRTGDHIATMRSFRPYSHHGIYDGDGDTYEYADDGIRLSSLETFADGDKLYLVDEDTDYEPEEIIDRAHSRLGEDEYNIFYNNCENFATWCRLGEEIF